MNLAEVEREKYSDIWNHVPEYRNASPGLDNVDHFWDLLVPRAGESLIDIGCGEGVAGLEFEKKGLQVFYLDITDAGLDPRVNRERFTQTALWSPYWARMHKYGIDYGFCCDVMEHIPTEFSMLVLDRIISTCRTTWFRIAFLPDSHGAAIGKTLHLTVQPFVWWRDRLRMLGDLVEARDICGAGVFVVKR